MSYTDTTLSQSITNKYKSIAIVTDDFLPAKTGVGVHVQQITPELVKTGHVVVVLTTRRPGQPAYEVWNGVHIHRFFSIPLAGFYQAVPSKNNILKILQEYRVEVVHFHYLSYLVYKTMQVARSIQLPTVYTAHMTVDYLTQPLLMKPFHRFLTWGYRWLINKADDIICVSGNQMSEFNPLKARVTTVSNPIDFNGNEAPDSTHPGTFKILYVGRLEPKKNLPYLIKSFHQLAARRRNAELVIAGTGTEEQALRRQVINADLYNKVTFLGQVDHDKLPKLYESCSVFVLPSVLETQGMVVLEAMRFRKPVIVTDKIISARELVEPGVNGFIVNANSVEDLTDKLTFFYDNPDQCKQMGQAGHDRFPVETAASVAKKLSEIYVQHCRPNLDPLPSRLCNVCGTTSSPKQVSRARSNVRRHREKTFEIWRCAHCESIHTQKELALAEYYKDYPLHQGNLDYFTRVWFGNFLKRLVKAGLKKEHHILDFGCGHGLFLRYLKEKGYLHGVGYDAYSQGFQDGSVLKRKYDWVIAVDVIEHVEDPQEFLELARTLLKPMGRLCLETPNADGIDMDHPEKNIDSLHLPFHRNILSHAGLVGMAQTQGFSRTASHLNYFRDSMWPGTSWEFIQSLMRAQGNDIDCVFENPKITLFLKNPSLLFKFFFGYLFPKTKAEMMVILEMSSLPSKNAKIPAKPLPQNVTQRKHGRKVPETYGIYTVAEGQQRS